MDTFFDTLRGDSRSLLRAPRDFFRSLREEDDFSRPLFFMLGMILIATVLWTAYGVKLVWTRFDSVQIAEMRTILAVRIAFFLLKDALQTLLYAVLGAILLQGYARLNAVSLEYRHAFLIAAYCAPASPLLALGAFLHGAPHSLWLALASAYTGFLLWCGLVEFAGLPAGRASLPPILFAAASYFLH